MNETIKLGIVLLIITALAGGILAGVNSMTAPVIAEREKLESFGALLEIFPDANDFVPIEDSLLDQIKSANGNVTEVLEATEDGNVVGYAFKVASGGFHGDIVFQLGLYSSGTVAGLKVMQHGETPGFGADITDKPEYAESFPGKNFTQGLNAVAAPSADNEVMALSGATVTTKGMMTGVNGAIEVFNDFLNN